MIKISNSITNRVLNTVLRNQVIPAPTRLKKRRTPLDFLGAAADDRGRVGCGAAAGDAVAAGEEDAGGS